MGGVDNIEGIMVRGHAKAVSQEKHAAKMAEKAKSMKRDSSEV